MISTRVSNPPLVKSRDGRRMRSYSHKKVYESVAGQMGVRRQRGASMPETTDHSRNLQLTAIRPAAKSSRTSANGRRRGPQAMLYRIRAAHFAGKA